MRPGASTAPVSDEPHGARRVDSGGGPLMLKRFHRRACCRWYMATRCRRQRGGAGRRRHRDRDGQPVRSAVPYFIGMSRGRAAGGQRLTANVEVLVTNADGDVEKLTSDIEDLIAQEVRAASSSLARSSNAAPAGPRGESQAAGDPGGHGRPEARREATTRAGSARTTVPSASRTAPSSSSSSVARASSASSVADRPTTPSAPIGRTAC